MKGWGVVGDLMAPACPEADTGPLIRHRTMDCIKMKHTAKTSLAVLTATLLTGSSAFAALVFSSGYSASNYYSHSNASDALYSFDWASDGGLYYATATSMGNFGGLYRNSGGSTNTIANGNSNFAGASVVSVGSSIYYNDSTFTDYTIYRYNTGNGATSSLNTANYTLGTDGTNLLTTGSANWTITDITLFSNGDFGPSVNLGGVAGSSGPLAFDGSGNLYYAPGYGDKSIYRWSALEVAAAISSGGVNALEATGHQFASYASDPLFNDVSGATSMVVDANGVLYATLTDFMNPSFLVKFDSTGSYEAIAKSDERLGELRVHNGNMYMSATNQIFQIVPEPSSFLLSVLACVSFTGVRRRR